MADRRLKPRLESKVRTWPVIGEADAPLVAVVLLLLMVLTGIGFVFADSLLAEPTRAARTHVIQLAGGAVLLLGSYFAARNVALLRRQQSSERLTKTLELLASESAAVRMGAIRQLADLARDEPRHAPVVEVALRAFAEPPEGSADCALASEALQQLNPPDNARR